jgi:diguanylate cyclase (GGDEF)-like protein
MKARHRHRYHENNWPTYRRRLRVISFLCGTAYLAAGVINISASPGALYAMLLGRGMVFLLTLVVSMLTFREDYNRVVEALVAVCLFAAGTVEILEIFLHPEVGLDGLPFLLLIVLLFYALYDNDAMYMGIAGITVSCIYLFFRTGTYTTPEQTIVLLAAFGVVNIGGIYHLESTQRTRYRIIRVFDLEIRINKRLRNEIEARRMAEEKLTEVSNRLAELVVTDELTGLANRRHMQSTLESQWGILQRSETPLSIVMGDVDHFKPFNDYYGHQAGDDCLKKIAHALVSSLERSSDVAVRYGGEEFVLVLPGTSEEGALKIARRVQSRLADLAIPHAASPSGDMVTISLGIATVIPDSKGSIKELLSGADRALYRAKAAGRNRIEIADDIP